MGVGRITARGDRLTRSTIGLPDRPSGIAAEQDLIWVTLGPSTDARYATTVMRINPDNEEFVGDPIPVLRSLIQPSLDGGYLWLLSPIEGTVAQVSTSPAASSGPRCASRMSPQT